MERVLTTNFRPGLPPMNLREYEAAGGYQALRKAIKEHTPGEVVQVVTDSNLRGRGGAGFPTGQKWANLPPCETCEQPRIMIANLDEMEPGTFKDRYLVENDPHQFLEGLLIACYACRSELAYVFVRDVYRKPAAELIEQALAEAEQAGYVGRNVLGSGWNCEVHVHMSAGRYICGEAMGILNAMEGRRAIPRTKPPHEVASGAWGKPTVVNNVETYCCVPHIVLRGAEWFRGLGKAKDAGTKIYGVSGRVKRPGSYELPMGTTLNELLDEAGGMQEGYQFKAALPGGASTMYLGSHEMDVPLEFEALKEIDCYFGTGTAIVVDDRTCIVGLTHNLQQFYARESCGWCTPCRDGLPWIEKLYRDQEEGRGKPGDVELLGELARSIGRNTFCALALGAIVSIESSIHKFRGEYDDHIRLGRCPFRDGH
jgi:NADH-quinone oxidoreductase subunit F